MKKYLPLLAVLLSGCLSSKKVSPGTADPSLMLFQKDGRVIIASLNSAFETKIIQQQQHGDTLLLSYKTGAWLYRRHFTPAQYTLPLTEQIRHVQCANGLYQVVKTTNGFRLEQL